MNRSTCTIVTVLLAGAVASAAELTQAVDCAADPRLLDSLFGRYPGPPEPQRILREPTGVRFYFPAIIQTIPQSGLYSYFSFAGDFEVTANYELTSMTKPQSGYGVTCGILVDTKGPQGSIALARGETVGKESGYIVTHGKVDDGETKYESTYYPSAAKAGRLILRREKADVICLVADGPQDEPRELIRLPFSAATIRQLRLVADLGGSHTSLDAKITNLQVRAVEIAGGIPKYEPPRNWGWLWWTGLGGVGVVALSLVGFRYRSGRWIWSRRED